LGQARSYRSMSTGKRNDPTTVKVCLNVIGVSPVLPVVSDPLI
jgi:hypothetical protein